MEFGALVERIRAGGGIPVRVDSRLVEQGDVFVAVRGTSFDGHDFLNQAMENGAAIVVCERMPETDCSAEAVIVEDSSVAAGLLAQASFGQPAANLVNLAVTGTNGKTTVAFLVRSVINSAGRKCGLLGTVLYDTGEGICAANLTTPDCLTIAEKQAEMVRAGLQYMVMEASSHAIEQQRLAGVRFRAAAFTNLTGDHLDYHKTKENYLDAKAGLFANLAPDAVAVLNKQSVESEAISRRTKAKILWYSIDEPADIRAHVESMDIEGTVFAIEYAGEKAHVTTPLIGPYNVANHLAAAGLCLAAGFDLQTVAKGLSALKTIPGRLEKVQAGQDFAVIIDYAHTDDALTNVLSTLKPLVKSRLIVVFGCGGDRDKTKRPRMARAAQKYGDIVIVTSDNPRTEDANAIIEDITAGFDGDGDTQITVEADREKAIALAISEAADGDVVVIAGKGHEDYQILGKKKIHFSDKEVALKYLKQKT